jgi:hypothetical protein
VVLAQFLDPLFHQCFVCFSSACISGGTIAIENLKGTLA